MNYEPDFCCEDNCVFSELDDDGELLLYFHYCPQFGVDDDIGTIWDAVNAWEKGAHDSCLHVRFRLSDALDVELDSNSYPDGRIDPERRPVIEAMRAELVSMLERIDAVKYAG
jgi:hypothetical protein